MRPARFVTFKGPRAGLSRRTMRKRTEPPTPKPTTASSTEQQGLIAKDHARRQSAGRKSTLDNRSHRTIQRSRRATQAKRAAARRRPELEWRVRRTSRAAHKHGARRQGASAPKRECEVSRCGPARLPRRCSPCSHGHRTRNRKPAPMSRRSLPESPCASSSPSGK